VQLPDFIERQYSVALFLVVVVEQFFDFHQLGRVAVNHQAAPGLSLFRPAQHPPYIIIQNNHGPVQAASS